MSNKLKLKDNEIYICKEGELCSIDKPKYGFGKTVIYWQDWKPIRTEINYTKEIK